MSDAFAPPIRMLRTGTGIDSTGSIMVDWDNSSGLNVLYGIDRVRKVVSSMTNSIKEQIPAIRDNGLTNMLIPT